MHNSNRREYFLRKILPYIVTGATCVAAIISVKNTVFATRSVPTSTEQPEWQKGSVSESQTTQDCSMEVFTLKIETSSETDAPKKVAEVITATANKAVEKSITQSDIETEKKSEVTTANVDLIAAGVTVEEAAQKVRGTVEAESPTEMEFYDYDFTESKEDWDEEYFYYRGAVLDPEKGTVIGPSAVETCYNLPMEGVVYLMNEVEGYDYDYWVRDDGVKMYGSYVMVGANLDIYPKGSIVKTSLGLGMVCDTGGEDHFPGLFDIAVTW